MSVNDSDTVLEFEGFAGFAMEDGGRLEVMGGHGLDYVDGLGRALADGESYTADTGVIFARFGDHCVYYTTAAAAEAQKAESAAYRAAHHAAHRDEEEMAEAA